MDIEKSIINRFERPNNNPNSVIDNEDLQKYSVDSILTDEENRTLWINGMPFGNAYIHFDKTDGVTAVSETQPTHAEIFNDFENNVALGNYSHAEGYNTTAAKACSHAEGYKTTSGEYAHSEGYITTANGQASHAEGCETLTRGVAAHAEGGSTTAGADYSHAEGQSTNATAPYSHAEGYNTNASGHGSHAEGDHTTANADYSHTEGKETSASANYSHAEGLGTETTNEAEHASGKYNKSNNGTIFSVGIGTIEERKNAIEITNDGDIYIGADNNGNNPCGYPGDSKTTLQYLIINQNLEEITYSVLVGKRNDGNLIPGKFYRIVDYITTTTQEDTVSAGYQFDIIVLALSTNTLSEDAWAVQHDFNKKDKDGNDIAHNINMCLIEKYFNDDGTVRNPDSFVYADKLPIQATYSTALTGNSMVTLTYIQDFELILNKILNNYAYNLTLKQSDNIIYSNEINLDIAVTSNGNYNFKGYNKKLPFSIFTTSFFTTFFNYSSVSLYVEDGTIPAFSINYKDTALNIQTLAICYKCISKSNAVSYLYFPVYTLSTTAIRYFIDNDTPQIGVSYSVTSTGTINLQNPMVQITLDDFRENASYFTINTKDFFNKYTVLLNTGDNQNSMHTSNGNVCSYDYLKENYLSTYFEKSKINAWKLRYSLDNTKDRFGWADNTKSDEVSNGKGVIYRMIDAFGNDCPYDFKNILFKTVAPYNYFTFNDYNTSGSTLTSVDASVSAPASTVNNKIINNASELPFNMFIKKAENTQFINNELNNCFKCNINANFENTKILYFNNQTITADKSNAMMLNGNIEANNVS